MECDPIPVSYTYVFMCVSYMCACEYVCYTYVRYIWEYVTHPTQMCVTYV